MSLVHRFAFSARPIFNTICRRNLTVSAIRCDIFTVQDEEDFKNKVRNSKVPVVIDFYASWCGPCKLLTPRLETVIGSQKDKVNLAKVDVDSLDAIAAEFEITSVPAVFGMKNGKVVDKFVGLVDEDKIQAFVEKLAMK
ncbi:thioredoxin-like protein [Leptotrombidium deliense]|uniref:Thioredoxin-like protein n=1 Tax=Leptotrombidium deliense TaxID=299467 RepID=A0A443S8H1_9ACAR|nr:thioredoxin-like protein [Leptotrombidium deliense]